MFRKSSLLDLRQHQDPDEPQAQAQTQKQWSRADILTTLRHIKSIIAHAHANDVANWDGTCLAIGMPGGSVSSLSSEMTVDAIVDEAASQEEWEEHCFEAGFEYVDCTGIAGRKEDGGGERNEYGELTGLARVRESLEAVEWDDLGDVGEVDDNVFTEQVDNPNGFEEEDAGFRIERQELEREFVGLKMEVAGNGDEAAGVSGIEDEEQDVEQLDVTLRKMLAVKEMSGHLSQAERERMARRVVSEIMRGRQDYF